MASSFEKSVKGATKIKAAPPKEKYIGHLLASTYSGEAGVGEVFRALQPRLRDASTLWTVVFKSLIVVHLMVRDGAPDVTLAYLAKHRNILAVSMFSDAQTQGRNIRHYSSYLTERARAYRDTKCDWVRAKESRLEKLSVDKGLLRETEAVQHQLTALLKCDVLDNEPENEITITVFRLLVLDLLALFQVLNQAMINILGHFFEMSKTDAERAMEIYRAFTKQTDFVVQYLGVARQYEHHTRVKVPKLRHAPVNLGRQLEDYLKDPDFEVNRRQYLAEQEAKKRGGGSGSSKAFKSETEGKASSNNRAAATTNGSKPGSRPPQATRGPDPDLIDFFDSIEQNQTPMAVQPVAQLQTGVNPWGPVPQFQNGFVAQPTGFQATNPFQQNMGAFIQQQQAPQPLQPAFTGAGFGGFTPQPAFQPGGLAPVPQDSAAAFPQPAFALQAQPTGGQSTNPFRQSMMPTGAPPAMPIGAAVMQTVPPGPASPQSTNPFARSTPTGSVGDSTPTFNTQATLPPAPAPLQPMATGTNPFARNFGGPQQMPAPAPPQGLVPQPTGSTNPFRHGAFVNHTTGVGWQHNQQPIGGGLDQLETIPVFPRPTQQAPWQG